MENAKHLTYLVTKKDGAYSFNTSFGNHTSSDLSDLENIERILANITSVYIGTVEPNDGMPALDAREDDIPMITAIEYDQGILEIVIISNNNDNVVELANTVAISEISPNQEITARILGDWCLDSLTGNSDNTQEQLSESALNDIRESIEAAQSFYPKNEVEFIIRAKDWLLEAHLNDYNFHSGKYDYLIDGMIKGLDPSINLRNIEAYHRHCS